MPVVPVLDMEITMAVSNQEEEVLPLSVLEIGPNPASDFINIEIESEILVSHSFQLTLAHATGRMLRQQVFKNQPQNNITWAVDKLQNGVYYLRLSTSQGSRTKKVMVQR